MKIRLISAIIFIQILLLNSVVAQNHSYANDLENPDTGVSWLGLSTIDSISAFSGRYFSHTDSKKTYGLGIEQPIPDDLIRKNTMLVVSGWVRSNMLDNNALFVVTLVDGSNSLLWKGVPLKPVFKKENEWSFFSDSILIPASVTIGVKLKAYLWNQNSNAETDIDNLKIEFKAFHNPTFIPVIDDESGIAARLDESKIIFENNYYSIFYQSDKILILNKIGDTIINNITYFIDDDNSKDKRGARLNLHLKKVKETVTGRILYFIFKNNNVAGKLSITCDNVSQKINFKIENKYKKSLSVFRESLIFNYSQPLAEVYRNNRKSDTAHFQKEYWLDKQGVKLGSAKQSLFIYHTPMLSSLQLAPEKHLLFVNLDFEKDHPFFRFPLNPDSTDWKKEESASSYSRGDKRTYSFNIFIGNNVSTIPRFMKNPAGFEATYIWTEHADFTDIRTNRAVYFGSENITSADSAVGGFVKFNIPVTKSVFYDNPDSITNYDASFGAFPSLEATILTDTLFADFLFQISKKGNEICLHTPEQFTTTHNRFEEALAYMKTNFGSPSWIDHGNNNALRSNREDLICDGTLEDSPYYAIDLWNSYDVRYLHNAYYEELVTFKDWKYESSMEKPFSGFGDFFPKPDYYLHPTRSKNMIHWTTTSALFVEEQNLWSYYFNFFKLQGLVDNRAVEINHTYPAWVNPKKGMWTYDSDSTIIAQPGFNMALANMAKLRDEGRLNVCTIADFLNYRTAIDSVEYNIMPYGRIHITNKNSKIIDNLSMVVRAKAVTVNGLIPNQKKVDDEIIFWFNVDANSSKVIRIIE